MLAAIRGHFIYTHAPRSPNSSEQAPPSSDPMFQTWERRHLANTGKMQRVTHRKNQNEHPYFPQPSRVFKAMMSLDPSLASKINSFC